MIVAFSFLLFCYCFILLKFYRGYIALRNTKRANIFQEKMPSNTGFTLIIPYRNEAEHLPDLLESLSSLNYPSTLFEVIMVNDDSEDDSLSIVRDYPLENLRNIQNIRSTASPKKDAITTAIASAKMEWIVTTDADCIVPPNWLLELDICIQKMQPKLICGPVLFKGNNSLLQDFQQLDNISLQGITMGSFGLQKPLLSNGANCTYKKAVFQELGGFSGNDHIASGDDVFMLEKIKTTYPKDLHYLFSENAIVQTQPEKTWKQVIQQRIRWASKTSQTKNKASIGLGLLVFFTNVSAILLLLISVYYPSLWPFTLLFWGIKISADILFMKPIQGLFATHISAIRKLQCSIIYPFISTWIVFKSITGTYSWKGRNHKK